MDLVRPAAPSPAFLVSSCILLSLSLCKVFSFLCYFLFYFGSLLPVFALTSPNCFLLQCILCVFVAVVFVLLCGAPVFPVCSLSVKVSQPVMAGGWPSLRLCRSFLPVKRTFFLPRCLPIGACMTFLWSLYLTIKNVSPVTSQLSPGQSFHMLIGEICLYKDFDSLMCTRR